MKLFCHANLLSTLLYYTMPVDSFESGTRLFVSQKSQPALIPFPPRLSCNVAPAKRCGQNRTKRRPDILPPFRFTHGRSLTITGLHSGVFGSPVTCVSHWSHSEEGQRAAFTVFHVGTTVPLSPGMYEYGDAKHERSPSLTHVYAKTHDICSPTARDQGCAEISYKVSVIT